MDKAQDRILLTILSTALIFGAQAIYEYIKKRKAEAKARNTRHTRPASAAGKSVAVRPAPFVDYELKEVSEKPAPAHESQLHPVSPTQHTSADHQPDSIGFSGPTSDDIRRAVIWSEILNRKYN